MRKERVVTMTEPTDAELVTAAKEIAHGYDSDEDAISFDDTPAISPGRGRRRLRPGVDMGALPTGRRLGMNGRGAGRWADLHLPAPAKINIVSAP